jgi:hypothetical protein
MSFQPFSAIGKGNIFHVISNPSITFMKSADDKAILLQGYWDGNTLHSRGTPVPFKCDTCVVAMTEGQVALDVVKVDPIDPRRKFWKEGDHKVVGQRRNALVNIFAGLYLYHGCGYGTYHSTTGEIFGGDSSWAYDLSQSEGVPFVLFDTFKWTNDPDLKFERSCAKKRFDDQKERSSQDAVSAVAEMA